MISTVNYHIIKACNFKCKFCYATFNDIRTKGLLKSEQFRLIDKLAESKMFQKINFAGGEPTLVPHIIELIKHSKSLGFETSIVTNGSKIDFEWVKKVSPFLDILAISVDSFDEKANLDSGRNNNGTTFPFNQLIEITNACHFFGINLKLNTVVTQFNKSQYLTPLINQIKPFRWKILQATKVIGQNDKEFELVKVSEKEFERFSKQNQKGLNKEIKAVIETNELIQGSYLMIDQKGRFYDSSLGRHNYSSCILDIGVNQSLEQISVDTIKFKKREGNYSMIKNSTNAHS